MIEPEFSDEMIAAAMAKANARLSVGNDRGYAFPDPLFEARKTCSPSGRESWDVA